MIENTVAGYLAKFFRVMDSISLKNFTRKFIREKGRKRKRIQALLYGVVTYYLVLERVAKTILGVKFDKLSYRKKFLALTYLYRILYQSIIPQDLKKDVLLKPLVRATFPEPEDEIDGVVIKTSFPRWVVEKLSNYMSLRKVEELLMAMNKRQPTYILVDPSKYSTEEAADYLKIEGVETEIDKDFPELLKIVRTSKSLHKTYMYKEGSILPISKASFAVVRALNPRAGDTVLDACAAPGVKTIASYFLCKGECEIHAYDVDPNRLDRMKKMLKKYSVTNITVHRFDARKLELKVDYDKVLVDAPCTSSGMVPDSPDVKLRLSEEYIEKFVVLQREILDNLVKQLSEDSILVYSTCSIFPEEGEEQILFLKNKYNVDTVEVGIGEPSYLGKDIGVRFYPNKNNTIAMFISKIRLGS